MIATRVPKTTVSSGRLLRSTMKARASLSLEGVDAGLEHALVFAGGVVLGVLAEVAEVAGGGDALGHLDHLDVLHAVQVGLEFLVAFSGHRDAFAGHDR